MFNIGFYYEQLQTYIAVAVGSILQILFAPNINYRLVMLILISSIFTALYIIKPTISYVGIKNDDIIVSMYATSSIVSVTVIRTIINILPSVLKLKALNALGIDIDKLNKEVKENANNKK